MIELFLGVVWSFGLCFLLTPWARIGASWLRLVDRPDGRRKLHGRSIPVAGGPVLLFSVAATLLAAFLCHGELQIQATAAIPRLAGLLTAALVICTVGVFDDLGRLRGRHKLLGQLIAIAAVIGSGVRIDSIRLMNVDFDLGILAVPFTAFFLLGTINSLNLLDGMDGLLTSIAFIFCLVLGSLALFAGKELTAWEAFAMAAALLAFLHYNFPPATIFLGDSGSMLIGLVVGVLAIDSALESPARMALAAPIALLSLPILDTAAAIVRRKLTGRSIYCTDRSHLHHCLLRRFNDPRHVLFVISSCCLVISAAVLAGQMLDCEWVPLLASLAVVIALIVTRLFGYAEFQMIVQRSRALLVSLVRVLPADRPRQIEMRLQGNVDWRELWLRIIAWDASLHLCCLRLDVNAPALGEGYHARWDCGLGVDEEEAKLWHAQIPLTIKGHTIGKLEMTGRCDSESISDKIAVLEKMIQDFENNVSRLGDDAIPAQTTSPAPAPSLLRAAGREGPEFQRANL
jgi:UDP-GlcNAc:undecaprenyl-phosphate GlcNAc-1-phosphate transferase